MQEKTDKGADYPSPRDMHDWLVQEVRDSGKAHELRVQEAVGFVTDYALGKISAEEAVKRHSQYLERWGEGLFGATAGKDMTDEEIIKAVDAARKSHLDRVFGKGERGNRSR